MKSVVVQGSTVAKAIEAAWMKAGKPEEYFIRVLQEHTSGFFGFGGQKAKVVLFFKNTHKSDSLIPTVLKQKEYANFFGNKHLKNPTQLDVIDQELNKNVVIGHTQKKKQHRPQDSNNQNQQKKQVVQQNASAQNNQQKPVLQTKPVQNQKNVQHNNTQAQQPKQVKQPVQIQEKVVHKVDQQRNHDKKNTTQVVLKVAHQPLDQKKVVQQLDKKEDVARDVTKVLKKVQSQKIVANVSRHGNQAVLAEKPQQKVENTKVVKPKFESYDKFMDAQADKNVTKNQIVEQTIEKNDQKVVHPVTDIVAKIESLHIDIKPHVSHEHHENTSQAQTSQKRPFVKMKRRPLATDNPGISGINKPVEMKNHDTHTQAVLDTVSYDQPKNNE